MRLVQWVDPKIRQRQVGLVLEENAGEMAVSLTSVFPKLLTTLDVLLWSRRHPALSRQIGLEARQRLAHARRIEWDRLRSARFGGHAPYLLPPIDVPSNPYALTLWGAGVTHLRSAQAREEEAKAERGRPASFYDLMYQDGLKGGKPKNPPGARPEIFYKADGFYTIGPNDSVRIAPTSKRCVPEPEVVSFYGSPYIYGEAPAGKTAKNTGRRANCGWTRIGYTLGDDFSDQGWESYNPLYLPHAKVQMGLAAIGPVFVTADDPLFNPREVAIRCRVYRGKSLLLDSGSLRTGEKHMAHSIRNLEFNLFDNRPLRPGEIRGLFWGTSAVFKIPLKPGDVIEIEASSGLDRLRNSTKTA